MKIFELIRDGEPVGIEARAPDYVCAQEYFKDKQWPIGFHHGRYFEVKEKRDYQAINTHKQQIFKKCFNKIQELKALRGSCGN